MGYSARNLTYAGYGSDDDITDMAAAPPGLISRFFQLALVLMFLLMLSAFAGLIALILKPQLIPQFQQQVTLLIQRATGLTADEIEAKRKEYSSRLDAHLPGAQTAHGASTRPRSAMPRTLTSRLVRVAAKRSTLPGPELSRVIAQVVERSKQLGLDPVLTAAVVSIDSGFDANKITDDAKAGLLQLDVDNGEYISQVSKVEWKGAAALTEPEYNLELGLAYIKFLDELFRGNTRYILMAKNVGARNFIDSSRNGQQMSEAVQYTDDVLNLYGRWQAEVGPE